MNDYIYINELRLETVIGVYPRERKIRQTLSLDLEIEIDLAIAGATDELEHTIDYAAVAADITHLASNASYQLIEALGDAICTLVLSKNTVQGVTLRLTKPNVIENATAVGICLSRKR